MAADGTVYDNGYGIALIPRTQLMTATWNNSNTVAGAYKASTMHTSHLPTVVSNLKKVLGSHIVTRNVLLSKSVDGNYHSNSYVWTTAEATLMSIGQMTGTFGSNQNQYDDGEAYYKLPIFNSKEYKTGSTFWSRGVWGSYNHCYAWYVYSDGSINAYYVSNTYGVRPLIYIR